MKVVTWNVNSLRARREYLEIYLEEHAPDVLCLQELKAEETQLPLEIFSKWGYEHLAIHGQKRWNGVLIASKFPLEEVVIGVPEIEAEQSRFISAVIKGVRIINLYCPQGQAVDSPKFEYKLRFFDELIRWIHANCDPQNPLLLLGDLNIAPRAEDIFDPVKFSKLPSFHPLEHERWERLMAFGLHDLVTPHIEPNTYSFWDYRRASFRFDRGMRIDHILATSTIQEKAPRAWIERDFRKKKKGLTPSDHAPVGIELKL